MSMLIDDFLPYFDAVERHATIVAAPADRVYETIWKVDLAASPVVRLLLIARALPGLLSGRGGGLPPLFRRASEPITLRSFSKQGFAILAEAPPRELLLGFSGAFWTPGGGLRQLDAETFRADQPPGTARAAWNFAIRKMADGRCLLSTETRVQCADAASRQRFRRYWQVIRPGSGLIRRLMLQTIRRAATR